jgi:tetratricopeptide (TPR) repeat protein
MKSFVVAASVAVASCFALSGSPVAAQLVNGKFGITDSTGATYRAIASDMRTRVAANAGDVVSRKALVAALYEIGEYDEAERVAAAGGAALSRKLAEIQLARGRRDAALTSYQSVLSAHAPDTAAAKLGIAMIHYNSGDHAGALRELEWFISFYNNSAKRLTSDELTAVGQAAAILGITDPQLFHDAVKAFEEAGTEDAKNIESRILEGALFLDKFDSRNGTPVLEEALAIDPQNPRVLVQLARAKRFDGSDEAIALVNRAIGINPSLVSARLLKAELLAASEDYAGAVAETEKALVVNAASIDALAMRAALAYQRNDKTTYEATRKLVASIDPLDTRLLTKTSELAGSERRFVESIALAREAAAIDSTAWDARTLAGMGSFRLGHFDEAAATLAAAFKGDPYNPWVKNTLDLLDTYPQYETARSKRFELLLNKKEADLIALYMEPLAELAYDTFAARYKWTPPENIRIEVYPRHGDFSVRTVGIAGLGALGVSFGDILAMDSPSARNIGEFHWASTMWHEVAHTFTLGLSKNRIPRWLTEGISGWEETHAHPGWGDPISPSFISAYATGRLPVLSKLTAAFIRPSYPEQVVHAYAMAELVMEEIVASRGVDAVRRMVAGFGGGKTQDQVFADVLHATPEQYDAEFDAYMRKRFASQLAAVDGGPRGPYGTAVGAGKALADAGDYDAAVKELQRAIALFPDYAGPNSPYELMLAIEKKRGNDRAAVTWLERITSSYAQNYDAWLELAALRDKLGDRKGSAAALEQAIYVSPYDAAVHDRLARLYTALARPKDAVRERRAIVALKPVDRAAAWYELALALEAAGDRAAAKTEVLKALEAAPGYAAAQELLLRLQGAR